VPKVDLEKNIETYLTLEEVIEKELVNSSLSLTSGGLAIALAKASIGGMLGCDISLDKIPGTSSSIDSLLFSESQGRILVSVSPKNINKFEKIIKDIHFKKIGNVSKDNKITIKYNNKKVIEKNIKRMFDIYHSFSNKME